jgi:prolyl 4-hydroxylase
MALLFDHGLIHEGAELAEGIKYVLRSDVMYEPIGQFTVNL